MYELIAGATVFGTLWLIFAWLVLSIAVAVIATERGHSGFLWFIAALLFSPMITGIMLIATPDVALEERQKKSLDKHMNDVRQGFDTLAQRLDDLRVVMERLQQGAPGAPPESAPPSPASSPEPAVPVMGYCPGCGKLRATSQTKCVYCGDVGPVLDKPKGQRT